MKKNILTTLVLFFLFEHLICLGQTKDSSKAESLFSESSSMHYVTRYGIQFTPIQNQVAGMIGLSSGVYFNQSFFVGLSGYVNLTHSKVNTGAFGVEAEYSFNSEKLVHLGFNIFAGVGTVKDYRTKNNLLDNFFNIFGTNYFFVQPSLILEINFTPTTRLAFGLGYKMVSGLDENSSEISITKLKNQDLNNVAMFVNLKMLSF